jgi:hypothetical protein
LTLFNNKYQKKYIKYKSKYLYAKKSIEGGNPNKKILLMFLGGAISAPNLIKHYAIMNEQFNNKDNFYIVIHPISLPYKVNEEFKKIFNPDNIFIVDENHHLLTAWATKSLSDATLMMMQYAHIQNSGNLFDKYILLSQNCCPLYTFDKIYDYITQNNKSYLSFSNGSYTDPYTVEISNTIYNKPIFKYGSQWMILDKQHVKIFFPVDISKTYIKDDTICCKFNERIQVIKIIENNNSENCYIKRIFNLFNIECTNTDECFFITSILYYIIHEKKYENWKEQLDLFNFYNTQYKIYNFPKDIYSKLENIYNYLNKKVKYIFPIYLPRYIEWHTNRVFDNFSDPLNNIFGAPNTYKNNDIYIKQTNQSTYCDWLYISIEPLNFLRNFEFTADSPNINLYLKNNPVNNYCILNKLVIDCPKFTNKLSCISKINEYIKKCIKQYGRDNKKCNIKPTFKNCTILPFSHPLEYSYYNIKSILNAFILINKLKCIIPEIKENDEYYHTFYCVYHLYKKILILEFEITDPQIISTLFLNWSNLDHREEIRNENKLDNQQLINLIFQNPELEKILEINIGTYITHNTLVSAMNSSSLFIRKCYDTSFIQEYSNILKECVIMNIPNSEDKLSVIQNLLPKFPMYSFNEEFVLQNYDFPEELLITRK